jgi:DNA-binding LacI/PurR family transcriptional regulator
MAQLDRPARPPSIRDVARTAGVSITLASFALNGRSGVAEGTRRRILAVAADLGYQANPHAQALRSGRTSTYGLVVRNLANPFFLDVISAAGEVANEAGATLLTLDSGYSLDLERRHIERLTGHRVAGLAIAPVGTGESVRLWLQLCPGLPTVALNATVTGIRGVSRVTPDNRQAVELPVRRLAALGHGEVAFLTAPRALMADGDRLRWFRRVARECGVAPRVVQTPLNLEAVRQATGRLLASRRPPTAIVCDSDYTALAVYKAARELSVRIGEELSVVGHDDLPTSELLDPPLATLRLDRRALGRALMARLLHPAPPSDHRQPVTLVERASMQG